MVVLCIVGDIINFLFKETIKSDGIFLFSAYTRNFWTIFKIAFHDKQNDDRSKQDH